MSLYCNNGNACPPTTGLLQWRVITVGEMHQETSSGDLVVTETVQACPCCAVVSWHPEWRMGQGGSGDCTSVKWLLGE